MGLSLASPGRASDLRLTAPPPVLFDVIRSYLKAGIKNIFLGYDHIAFLIAVVSWARTLWPVIKIVTAFTLAHSIASSLATLQIVVIPSSIVEPAIAASIVYVAVENFFPATSTVAGATPSCSG
jgi:hydrogenase/urease accessory protein HupE